MSRIALEAAAQTHAPTNASRLVLYGLAWFHHYITGRCFPSIEALAEQSGVDEKTVRLSLAALAGATPALIEVREQAGESYGGRRTNAYELLFVSRYIAAKKGATPGFRHDASPDASSPAAIPGATPGIGERQGTLGEKQGDFPGATPANRGKGNLKPGTKAPGATKEQVEAIWSAIPDQRSPKGVVPPLPDIRKRSESRGVVEAALSARLREGHPFERVLAGVQAYYADPDVAKEGPHGPFHYAKGVQRVLTRGLWLTYVEADEPIPGASGLALQPDEGATLAPHQGYVADWQARVWLSELKESPASWRSERGPLPGQPGCRVPPETQRAFGFRPAEDGPKEGPNDA